MTEGQPVNQVEEISPRTLADSLWDLAYAAIDYREAVKSNGQIPEAIMNYHTNAQRFADISMYLELEKIGSVPKKLTELRARIKRSTPANITQEPDYLIELIEESLSLIHI